MQTANIYLTVEKYYHLAMIQKKSSAFKLSLPKDLPAVLNKGIK